MALSRLQAKRTHVLRTPFAHDIRDIGVGAANWIQVRRQYTVEGSPLEAALRPSHPEAILTLPRSWAAKKIPRKKQSRALSVKAT